MTSGAGQRPDGPAGGGHRYGGGPGRRTGVPGGRRRDVIEQFAGPQGCGEALRDVTSSLRKTADTLHREPLPAGPATPEIGAALVRRGVRVRALYPQSVLDHPEPARFLRQLSAAGIAVRVVDHVAHDLMIFDGHTVCLPNGEPYRPAMLRISSAALTGSFRSIYETYWRRARPLAPMRLPARRPRAAAELDLRELAVIRLMAQGHDDERIAGQLGLGVRAVADVTHTLMERLGAASRFELGFRLGYGYEPDPLDPQNPSDPLDPWSRPDRLDP